MMKFEGLPDIPPNWLNLLYAETIALQKTMPQDLAEAQEKARQSNEAELKELQEKCPEIYKFIQISNEALHTSLVESGFKTELASKLTGRFILSILALLRLLAIALRDEKG